MINVFAARYHPSASLGYWPERTIVFNGCLLRHLQPRFIPRPCNDNNPSCP